MLAHEGAGSPATPCRRRLVPCADQGEPPTIQARHQAGARDGGWATGRRSRAGNSQEHSQTGRAQPMKILVVVERTDSGYSAFAPDVPGCVATGDSRQEVERSIQEAIG